MGKAAVFYAWMTAALRPLVFLHLRVRRLRGLELPMHGPEKAGYASAARPNGSLLWFHAVSVGEGMEAIPVIKQCLKTRPHVSILMTTSTVTAFSILQQTLPKGVICQFAPVDTPSAVERFLMHWKPQAAVFMESELWPNLILESSKQGIRLALLNARISRKSFQRWSLTPARHLAADMISKFSLIMPVNNIEALRYQGLGALPHQILFGGNLKYASGAMEFAAVNGPLYHDLRTRLLGRHVWLAASTHAGEEEVVTSVHRRLMQLYPKLLTIIVPRHPQRGHQIKAHILQKYCWEAALRSLSEPLTRSTEIYIADTIGELAMFYHLVSPVFVGGSLFKNLQGHNIAEPASAGCAVVTGSYVGHFQEMVAQMQRHSPLSVQQVANEDELYKFVHGMFEDGQSLSSRREAALAGSQSAATHVVERVYKWLNYVILNPAFGTDFQRSRSATKLA